MTKEKKKKRSSYIGLNVPESLLDYVEKKAKKASTEYKKVTITDVVIEALVNQKSIDEKEIK